MAKNINGNKDGTNGENQSYTIHGRGVVSRSKLVKEINAGRHPDFHVIDVNGQKFARANRDCSTNNNIDK
ncbi:DUF3892 domain-containing protein [Agarivorans aestuarii]|uniref:DUF3892 domain-containing protein n=1 Tax=Agarivorans aestuarii TaxID=1563703 RepID=A0ABU7G4X9_9ALTE|nr:DUF3892 domain-containing protein [Agarivorans aestuarii]MEE1674214.1 DUF3892 domain-containing protein [Agarivorans aestuarii]